MFTGKRRGTVAMLLLLILLCGGMTGFVLFTASGVRSRENVFRGYAPVFDMGVRKNGVHTHMEYFEESIPLISAVVSHATKTIGLVGNEYRTFAPSTTLKTHIEAMLKTFGFKTRVRPLGGLFSAYWLRGDFKVAAFIPNLPAQIESGTYICEFFLFLNNESELRKSWLGVQELSAKYVPIPVTEYIW